MGDIIERKALEIISDAKEVLETREILENLQVSLGEVTRTKLFARLNNLRGDGLIKGKFVGPGKGVWIWWKKGTFSQEENSSKIKPRVEKQEATKDENFY
jgi:hypothetical protein